MATESEGEEDVGTRLSGNQHLVVDDDLREMAKKAAWSVSSCKPGNGVLSLRDDNLDTYWQSDGAQPHLVNIQFQKKVKLQLLVLYVDFKLDESYTPSKISIRAGDGFHNLKEIKTVELVKPVGWVYISLSGTDPRHLGVSLPRPCTSGEEQVLHCRPRTCRCCWRANIKLPLIDENQQGPDSLAH